MKFSTLVTKSDLSAARKIEPLVLKELQRHAYSEESIFAIRLALEEALANAINHGNGRDPDKKVRVEYHIDAKRAVIKVCDEGNGFDRSIVPDPTAPENIEKDSGRGIMLMEAYMNEVRWNRNGSCVELVKKNE